MKTSSAVLLPEISNSNLKSLTSIVKEVVAMDLVKKFTAVNLWKIQQKKKGAGLKRRFSGSIQFI